MTRDSATGEMTDNNSIVVSAAGLCCALGYHLDAAVCAIRANMDHFQESMFYSAPTVPLNIAMLPDESYGPQRIRSWIDYALRDCAQNTTDAHLLFDPLCTALIVLVPDNERITSDKKNFEDLAQSAMLHLRKEISPHPETDGLDIPYRIRVLLEGRAGLAQALLMVADELASRQVKQVLLIAADSYLNNVEINFYLEQSRLFVPGNSDGFLPGEAAVALLLRLGSSDERGLHIKGIGIGHETGRWDGSVPSRGIGLTNAIRAACKQAKISPEDLDFRSSDQNGEQFYANDAANAITRVMCGSHKLSHLTLADKIGEVGCATGPAILAWLSRGMQHSTYSAGTTGLIHLSNDNGARCAVVVQNHGDV
ncbi:hypothetical protein [Massilia sp. CCM 8734]|uniref:hypothetical protein n=1 Tax=Massilia sp. CCM 8734 TaxID=2609283 RepID=UPI001420010D|nr:hypothetical protein [Massilia sp. CCM 8734]NIA00925.1 hypothetical protein [Massilia sp. CCM 8734]